jgi:NAD(P)-dependent dehydrogenase (short-subunit alcohol dehydrogenase family)
MDALSQLPRMLACVCQLPFFVPSFLTLFVDGNFGQANVGFHFQIGFKDIDNRELQYSTAKAGIIGLTKTLAFEGKKYNVLANVIVPVAGTAMSSTVWSVFIHPVHFNSFEFFFWQDSRDG